MGSVLPLVALTRSLFRASPRLRARGPRCRLFRCPRACSLQPVSSSNVRLKTIYRWARLRGYLHGGCALGRHTRCVPKPPYCQPWVEKHGARRWAMPAAISGSGTTNHPLRYRMPSWPSRDTGLPVVHGRPKPSGCLPTLALRESPDDWLMAIVNGKIFGVASKPVSAIGVTGG